HKEEKDGGCNSKKIMGSRNQDNFFRHHLEDKVVFEGVESVTPVLQEDGRPKRPQREKSKPLVMLLGNLSNRRLEMSRRLMEMCKKIRNPKASEDPSKKFCTPKGSPHVPISKSNVLTSNPYDVLDDMESEEDVEVV
ncbi:hypothetical protein Tco_1463202, partial [Tanacetum coccineum]